MISERHLVTLPYPTIIYNSGCLVKEEWAALYLRCKPGSSKMSHGTIPPLHRNYTNFDWIQCSNHYSSHLTMIEIYYTKGNEWMTRGIVEAHLHFVLITSDDPAPIANEVVKATLPINLIEIPIAARKSVDFQWRVVQVWQGEDSW